MTPERATQIIKDAREKSAIGPWSDMLDKVMTKDERAEVIAVWNTMPGYTCFVDALNRIASGQGEMNAQDRARAHLSKLLRTV